MDMTTLTHIFGWMTALNTAMLLFATLAIWAARDWVARIHASMFDMAEMDVKSGYFDYLSRYKTLILVFNLAPYLALRIVA
ncbi:MAG: DUF6868 family protein [Pseudomonadota bacterium]